MPQDNRPFLKDPSNLEHRLLKKSVILGRAVECDIVIASKNISRENTRIHHEGHNWFVEDLGSTNGTYLNEERIITSVKLRDGDCLRVGDVAFIFHDPDTTTHDNPVPVLEVDPAAGVVRVNRKSVILSPKEYLLLTYLYGRRGQVCSKEDIGHAVWPEYEAAGIFDYQIENLVRRLRTRIEYDPAVPQLLFTVRGLGYKLMAP